MDVVINKRKIRDTVKQQVDHGRKNLKQENRNYLDNAVFQAPCLIRDGFGWTPCMVVTPVMTVKPF